MALTVLTDLRHLRLAVNSPQSQKEGKFMTDEQRALLPLPNQMWEGLTKLTHLDLAQQVGREMLRMRWQRATGSNQMCKPMQPFHLHECM